MTVLPRVDRVFGAPLVESGTRQTRVYINGDSGGKTPVPGDSASVAAGQQGAGISPVPGNGRMTG